MRKLATDEERRKNRLESVRKYDQKNKEARHQYYLDHRDDILQKMKGYRQEHKEERRGYVRNQDPLKKKHWQLMAKYGMSIEEFDLRKEKQHNLCAICQNPFSENPKYIHVDHDHTSGKVRGILCNHCNSILGLGSENILIFESVIKYLKENV